jgi:hypothetical protein
VPASSGEATASGGGTVTDPTARDPEEDTPLTPPPIVLLSDVGKQRAVVGSYCLDYVDEATGQGRGACADSTAPHPRRVTSVAPGDRVSIVVEGATVKQDSTVTIRPLGCSDQKVDQLAFEPWTGELEWTVDLDHGAYQLDVFALFEAEDGRKGDVSGTLGLTVAGPKKWDAPGVRPVEPDMKVCPFEP